MAKSGKGGFLDRIKHELMEDDGATESAGKTLTSGTPVAAPSTAPIIAPTMPYTFGVTPAAGPEPADAETLKLVTDGVFGSNLNGHPSRYLMFKKMYEALGKPANPGIALTALQVSDSSITPGGIAEDIQSHLTLLDGVGKQADSDLQAAATQKLGEADDKIKSLSEQNEVAKSEIERHQHETNDRIGQIAQLQADRANSVAAIARANARADSAEASVRSELQAMQQLFSSIAAS
jgi:hypothetical protein